MPSTPEFDYYAALEVENTATPQELTAAYHRLARIHHPDRNFGNVEAATATFQRIQLAYETLSNPQRRTRYDLGLNPPASSSRRSSTSSSESSFDPFDSATSDEGNNFYYFFFDDQARRRAEAVDALNRHILAEFLTRLAEAKGREEARRQEEKAKEEARKEREEKEAETERLQKAREEARVIMEETKMREKQDRQREEKAKQEVRWEAHHAQTKEEKQNICLHSSSCEKTQHRGKVKCGSCNVKRGITSFECPYCSLSICQKCIFDFEKKRIATDNQSATKPSTDSATEPSSSVEAESISEDKSTAEPEPATKPAPVVDPEPTPEDKPATNPEPTTQQKPQGNSKNGTGNKKPGNGNQNKPRCYNCNMIGHIAKHCRNRHTNQGQKAYVGNTKADNGNYN
ncbi:DnaJ-domain-containing protein [Hypoxylon trugodes]|uniref:DnaJ-domain-containing protein n=1 Tax=Hypoxylon trugodes TaxID=326681 RepID=UPI00219F0DF3|nr:DnaJ-domain-containing protein [Hypoxylon trugodes]KAI1392701.1 DnaJ-domain-containing protein [Hypoxylon trugodes]